MKEQYQTYEKWAQNEKVDIKACIDPISVKAKEAHKAIHQLADDCMRQKYARNRLLNELIIKKFLEIQNSMLEFNRRISNCFNEPEGIDQVEAKSCAAEVRILSNFFYKILSMQNIKLTFGTNLLALFRFRWGWI